MKRTARSFRPAVDKLEPKELLSVGLEPQLVAAGHHQARHHHSRHSQQAIYYYYLNVKNDTGGTIGSGLIGWSLVNTSGQTLYSGYIDTPLNNGAVTQLDEGPSSDSLGDTYTITYNGNVNSNIMASSSSTGVPIYVPTFDVTNSAKQVPPMCHGHGRMR